MDSDAKQEVSPLLEDLCAANSFAYSSPFEDEDGHTDRPSTIRPSTIRPSTIRPSTIRPFSARFMGENGVEKHEQKKEGDKGSEK